MNKPKLIYGVSEISLMLDEIQINSKQGLISKIINENTDDWIYLVNEKIINSLLERIQEKSIVEFDEYLKIYTIFNELVPQIYGEGNTKDKAINQMVLEAKSFAKDYAENVELFSNILDGTQQFFVSILLLNIEDDSKLREVLKVYWYL